MKARLRNCPRCGRIFAYTGQRICSDCLREENEQFDLVRDYIRQNPRANIIEVSKATGVSLARIREFLRQGRLLLAGEGGDIKVECEVCGAPITSGRLCSRCADRLEKETSRVVKQSNSGRGGVKRGQLYTKDRLLKRSD